LIVSKGYHWKGVEVSLHSHRPSLAPSKQRSRAHTLTGQYLRYVRSASFLWWMQQKEQQFFSWRYNPQWGFILQPRTTVTDLKSSRRPRLTLRENLGKECGNKKENSNRHED